MSDTAKSTTKIKKRILAISAAAREIPVKPNRPATMATTKNIKAYLSMGNLRFMVYGWVPPQKITHQTLLWGHAGSPHVEFRPLSRKVDVIVMDLSILDVHMGEPHIRGAAAGAVRLEVQSVNPGVPAVYPQVIKTAHRMAPVDLHFLRTCPVSGRINEHKFSRGGTPGIGFDADIQSLGGGGAGKNGRGRNDEKPHR